MLKIATIMNNDLQELKDEVNDYCSRNPYVVDVDIFQHFTKPKLTDSSTPNSYVAVIKYAYNLRGE